MYRGSVQISPGGVLVRAEPPGPARKPAPVHLHLPWPAPTPRARTHDAPPPARRPAVRADQMARPMRPGDQDPEPALLCTIRQDGETGEWAGEDPDGTPLQVKSGGVGGGLEIWHPGTADQSDPGFEQKNPAEDRRRRMAASLSPHRSADQQTRASLGVLQRLLDSHYGRH